MKKFGGSWCAEEAPGVAPCFPGPSGKQRAIDYARGNRFGGSSGEIHVCDEAGRVFIVDAYRSESPGRFIVHSDELLTAFLELEEQLRRAAQPTNHVDG